MLRMQVGMWFSAIYHWEFCKNKMRNKTQMLEWIHHFISSDTNLDLLGIGCATSAAAFQNYSNKKQDKTSVHENLECYFKSSSQF